MSPSFRSLFRFTLPVLSLIFLGQGCFGGKSTATGPDGGVWKTTDRGQTWVNKRALVQGAKVTTGAANVAVLAMAFDPQDSATIYLGTTENGLVYSIDGGDSWQLARGLSAGRINVVAVDPKNKCVVYATRANEIF